MPMVPCTISSAELERSSAFKADLVRVLGLELDLSEEAILTKLGEKLRESTSGENSMRYDTTPLHDNAHTYMADALKAL